MVDQTKSYRLDGKVFRLTHGVWRRCLENDVRAEDVQFHSRRYDALNVPHSKQIAALRALEDKLVRKGGYNK